MGRESLFDDPPEDCGTGVRHGRVVPIHEREPVVAVAEVQLLPESFGVLVHETENAVVPAGEDVHLLELQSDPLLFVLLDLVESHLPAAGHLEKKLLRPFAEAIVDGVKHFLSIDFKQVVPGLQTDFFADARRFHDSEFHPLLPPMITPVHRSPSTPVIATSTMEFPSALSAGSATRT